MKDLHNSLGLYLSKIVLPTFILVTSLVVQPTQAEQQPDTLLRETMETLLDQFSSNRRELEADNCQLYSLVNDLVRPRFAVGKIVRLILGKHFQVASPEIQNRFTEAFMEMMIRTYATTMFEYSEQGLVPPPPEILKWNESSGTVLLRQRVPVSGQAPVLVDYVMWRNNDGHWQILDIKIDHISLVLSYRLHYDPLIKNKGFDVFLFSLETKIENC